MQLRCPLCLAPVVKGTRFLRVCAKHHASSGLAGEVEVAGDAAEQLLDRLRCPVVGCPSNRGIFYPAVYVCHVGCPEGKNPLAGSMAPGAGPRTFRAPHPKGRGSEPVGHWQASLENLVAESYLPGPPPAEMFFPVALLRATGRTAGEGGAGRTGVMVELSGPTKVGKTLLAMQALDLQGYGKLITREVGKLVGDFIYCSPEPPGSSTPGQTYLQTLKMRELMEKNRVFHDWLDGTPERPRNVKAAFFSRSPVPRSAEEPEKGFATELAGAWDLIRTMGRRAFGSGTARADASTIVFYDLAGETSEGAAHVRTRDHEKSVDVMAVVAGFPDVAADPPNLGDVKGRLGEASRWKEARLRDGVRCCLVLTKLDLLSCPEVDAAFRARLRKGPRSADRALLLELVETMRSTRPHPNFDELADLLGPGGPVSDVFFVWTENIETDSPQSHGLEDFVVWCLRGGRLA